MEPASWGLDTHNTRLQTNSTIDVSNVSGLQLKWVYGLANDIPRSFPLVTEDTIFIGDAGFGVVALDRESGCVRWTYEAQGIASAILHRRNGNDVTLYATIRDKGIVALDAVDGIQLWLSAPGDNPIPMYSGTPLVYADDIFVPLSSAEVGYAISPLYGCCETSGGMASINASTGETNWYTRTIKEQPEITGRRWFFIETHGPSGAPVWSAPMLDPKRGLLFFGTGQNYSLPASNTSDAIFAVNVHDGSTRWIRQFTKDDVYNLACNAGLPNCPDTVGPDVDFGAPPVLATLPDGRDILLAGQKSGHVHAMNPDTGDVVWQRKPGRGGALGGVHWGLAVNNQRSLVFVPISDIWTGELTGKGEPAPGLHALDIETGETRWFHIRKSRCAEQFCWGGISAAITATKDLVFIGSMDGMIEAVNAESGEVLWKHDTWQQYTTINGVEAVGGAIDAHGPMLVDDLLIVSSGYASYGQKPGNALLVFQLPEGDQ